MSFRPFYQHVVGELDQRRRNSSGIRDGWALFRVLAPATVPELTAGPSEADPRPLPGGSPIKMCRNARRKKLHRTGSNSKITAPLLGTLRFVLKKMPFTP